MLDGAMLVWFVLTGFSTLFVVWDSFTNGVTSWVQRLAWILVTFYSGPLGAFFYLIACRRPFPGGHDTFTKATWKQGLNSEMHCLAGDATGIVVAASIVPLFGLSNGWDATIEYLAGFICGLFIFQALMMVDMYDGDYWKAVRKTFFVETVSMNFVMAGMIPAMLLLAAYWPRSEDPTHPSFWFRMSMASIVGGILAYPMNFWLVKRHLKHGCMTLPGADGPAPGMGHASPEPANAHYKMSGHDHGIGKPRHVEGHQHAGHMLGGDQSEAGMHMPDISMTAKVLWIGISFAVLFLALWLVSFYTTIQF